MKGLYHGLGRGGAPFHTDHLLNMGMVSVGIVHALSDQNGLILSGCRPHYLSGKNLHIVPGLTLPHLGNCEKDNPIKR